MRRPTRQLTEAECRVLEAVAADGVNSLMAWKDVAVYLGRSLNTVTTLAASAYRKLGVRDKEAAVRRHRRLREHTCLFRIPTELESQGLAKASHIDARIGLP